MNFLLISLNSQNAISSKTVQSAKYSHRISLDNWLLGRIDLVMRLTSWIRKRFHLLLSFSILIGIGFGVRAAMHSTLFTVESVYVVNADQELAFQSLPKNTVHQSPYNRNLTSASILKLADVPTGHMSIFDLDLESIENRLMANDWIAHVQLEKKLPRSLAIIVSYRKPRAITQTSAGSLAYVDDTGRQFGSVEMTDVPDLPLLTGVTENAEQRTEKYKSALHFISEWESVSLNRVALLSSLYWDAKKGFQALVAYPLMWPSQRQTVKAMIQLGQDIDTRLEMRFFSTFEGSSIFK